MVVVEGVSGFWHYHLAEDATPLIALCGAFVMKSLVPYDQWKKPFGEHFPKRAKFCGQCDLIATQKRITDAFVSEKTRIIVL